MKRTLLALAVAAVCAPAFGQTTLYVSKCGPQAVSGCIAGANGNAGTSSSAPKEDFVGQINLSTIAAGSTVRLACGGHWENPGQWYIERLTDLNVTIEPYQHPGGGAPVCNISDVLTAYNASDTRPRLTYDTDTTAIYCQGGSCVGITIDGLRIFSTGSTSAPGIFVFAPTTNVHITRNDIQGFVIPVYPFTGTNTGDPIHEYMTIDANRMANGAHGLHGGFAHSLVQRNLLTGNNSHTVENGGQQHGLYVSCPANECKGNLIRWNYLYNNSINSSTGQVYSGKCNGGNFTYRGRITESTIERNKIVNDVGGGTARCYGFSLGAGYSPDPAENYGIEYIRRSFLRDNVVSGASYAYAITTATDMQIDGNKALMTTAQIGDPFYGLYMPHRDYDTRHADDVDARAKVRNFYCLMNSPGAGSSCAHTLLNAGYSAGVGIDMTNMHAHFIANVSNANAWDIEDTLGNYSRMQGLAVTGSNRLWHGSYTSLASFNTRFNNLPSGAVAGAVDATSADTATTPTSANGWTCTLNSSSPLVDAGTATSRARMSFGTARVGSTDIGACTDR